MLIYNTSTPTGKMFFGFFAVLAEFERDLIIERTKAGLESARARGKKRWTKVCINQSTNKTSTSCHG